MKAVEEERHGLGVVRWEADSAQGPVLLCLHGFTGSANDWAGLAGALGGEAEVVATHLPGHGTSPVRADFAETRRALGALAEDFAGREVLLLGYSMGGRLALHLLCEAPERYAAGVTVGANPGLPSTEEREARRRSDGQLARKAEVLGLEIFLQAWWRVPLIAETFTRIGPPATRALQERRLRENDPKGLAWALRTLGAGSLPSLWEELENLAVPVLALAGEEDTKFREEATKMAARSEKVHTGVIPACGHAPHLERPEELASVLQRELFRGKVL